MRTADGSNKVTTIIPVYNEERFLRQCLGSVIHQADCVIIGDNASTDGTGGIGLEFANQYKHVQYIRHETNIGAIQNLARIASLVKTEYVFQMGGHDELPVNFVATLKSRLQANPDAVCAYGNCYWMELDGTISKTLDFASIQTGMLDKDPYVRATAFFREKQPFDLIFGMYRSAVAIPIVMETKPVAGCDYLLPVASLLAGKFVFAPETAYWRRKVHPQDTDKDYMTRIVGDHFVKLSRDNSAIGRQLLDWFWQHHNQQILSSVQEKTFKELLFQMAWRLDTPVSHPFWDSMFFLRRFWRNWYKYLKCRFIPGYAERKNL